MALLRSSQHYEVFRDLQDVCKRLGIRICVARPTIDEIRNVAAYQEAEAAPLYDQVPESLSRQVRGDFFQAYIALKKTKLDARPEEVFQPFHDLAESVRAVLGVEIIDDKHFEQIPYAADFNATKAIIKETSQKLKRLKFSNAIAHDSTVYMFLKQYSGPVPDTTWLVTRDASLPRAWAALQGKDTSIRALLLDGLLQSISPFILDKDVKSFSELFSEAITAQLLPQSRLFDIDDFVLFQAMELDCNELTDAEVQEGLLKIKAHVLHGASFREQEPGIVAYQLKRFFRKRSERLDLLTAERDRLELTIAKLQKAIEENDAQHASEISTLKGEHCSLKQQLDNLSALENLRASKKKGRIRLWKKLLGLGALVLIEWKVMLVAIKLGEGANPAQRIASFSVYVMLAAGLWLVAMKWLFFRREKLKDVFPTFAEVKDLLP